VFCATKGPACFACPACSVICACTLTLRIRLWAYFCRDCVPDTEAHEIRMHLPASVAMGACFLAVVGILPWLVKFPWRNRVSYGASAGHSSPFSLLSANSDVQWFMLAGAVFAAVSSVYVCTWQPAFCHISNWLCACGVCSDVTQRLPELSSQYGVASAFPFFLAFWGILLWCYVLSPVFRRVGALSVRVHAVLTVLFAEV
jgi:hypothetical protein